MNYPLISEYIEAIKSPEDNFDKLRHLRPVLDDDGNPIMSSGNYAVVFKMTDGVNYYAIKCFTKEQEGRAIAYNKICKYINRLDTAFISKVYFYNNELFVDSETTNCCEFPVLVMDWYNGIPIDEYVKRHKHDKKKITLLYNHFCELSDFIVNNEFAHGDIKPDNLLVQNDGTIKLLDYDGMFVPEMDGEIARELGTPDYINPNRTIFDFNKDIDHFSLVLICLLIRIHKNCPVNDDWEFNVMSNDISQNEILIKQCMNEYHDDKILYFFQMLKFVLAKSKLPQNFQFTKFLLDKSDDYIDLRKEVCRLENIKKAVDLAYYARCFDDPYRDEKEIVLYQSDSSRMELAKCILKDISEENDHIVDKDNPVFVNFPKANTGTERRGSFTSLKAYSLKYLFAIVRFKQTPFYSQQFFGGYKELFENSTGEPKYKPFLEEFLTWQRRQSDKFKILYSFDIKSFFDNVSINKLCNLYFSNHFTNTEWLDDLFVKIFKIDSLNGLNLASSIDSYYANLYLTSLDNLFFNNKLFSYGRLTDDIRIFSDHDNAFSYLFDKISDICENLNLQLNAEKCNIVNTNIAKNELENKFFINASTLMYVERENGEDFSVEVDSLNIEEIIEKDYTSEYIFDILQKISNRVDVEIWYDRYISHARNLEKILRTVFKTQRFFKYISRAYVSFGIRLCDISIADFQNDNAHRIILDGLINLLKDDKVPNYTKYWLLRSLYLENDAYQTFENAENVGARFIMDSSQTHKEFDLHNCVIELSVSECLMISKTARWIIENIFQKKEKYNKISNIPDCYEIKRTIKFSQKDISDVSYAIIVMSKYGNSVMFMFNNGQKRYFPLSPESNVLPGECISLKYSKIQIYNLIEGKNKEDDLYRILAYSD